MLKIKWYICLKSTKEYAFDFNTKVSFQVEKM